MQSEDVATYLEFLGIVIMTKMILLCRFHDLQWSGLGGEASGVIYGGCEDGGLYIYDAAKLQANSPKSLLGNTLGQHAGPVYTLSANHLKVQCCFIKGCHREK